MPGQVGPMMAAPVIFQWGTDEQKKRLVEPIWRGREFWCQFFSEPGAGSDLAGIQTGAELDGDEWIMNGQKVWNSGAHHADRLLLARTESSVPKHRGISFFIIDVRQPGIEARPLRLLTGASHFNEVFFTDARVPASNLIGGVDTGWPCPRWGTSAGWRAPGSPTASCTCQTSATASSATSSTR